MRSVAHWKGIASDLEYAAGAFLNSRGCRHFSVDNAVDQTHSLLTNTDRKLTKIEALALAALDELAALKAPSPTAQPALMDQFAMAVSAYFINSAEADGHTHPLAVAARKSYAFAAEMLEARNGGGK